MKAVSHFSDPALLTFLQTRLKTKEKNEQLDEEMEVQNVCDAHPSVGELKHTLEMIDTKHVQFEENVSVRQYEKEEEDFVQQMEDGTLRIGDVTLSKNMLHMDKVEEEKLRWMRDCPTPSAVERKVHTLISAKFHEFEKSGSQRMIGVCYDVAAVFVSVVSHQGRCGIKLGNSIVDHTRFHFLAWHFLGK